MTNCIGLDGIPVAPLSPLEAAHDRWGKDSDVFVAFGPVGKEAFLREEGA